MLRITKYLGKHCKCHHTLSLSTVWAWNKATVTAHCLRNIWQNTTHFSSRRLWFTRKASLSACTPSSLIWFSLRLQNVREQEMRGGSTNLFTLWKACIFGLGTSLSTWEPRNRSLQFFHCCTIDIPISALTLIFINCGMCGIFTQKVTYI